VKKLNQQQLTKGVCHTITLPLALKKYLKAKEELWKLKNISPSKKYNLPKNPLKETKILQVTITLTNLKFQHKPKYDLSRNLTQK
jgi:hypothetical protein